MADNVGVRPSTTTGSLNIVVDPVTEGGVLTHYPKYKQSFGPDGTSPTTVTEDNPLPVNAQLNTTAFGDLKVESMSPVLQISAEYGLLNQVLTVIDAGASGTATVVDNKFTCQTGTDAGGLSSITSLSLLTYRPGQGAVARFTTVFTTGVANNNQVGGLISSENLFAFGYLGTVFGIIYGHDGRTETQELTITTASTGSENATVTIDGTGYTVPLTVGTVQHNAFEISESLNAQVSNYDFSSNDDQVVAQAIISDAMGSFAFSSGTAVAAWAQITSGTPPDLSDFIPQADWSENNFSSLTPSFDPTKGNVYQIQFQYLGFGAIKFYIEDPATGNYILVHIIKYANTATIPSVTNPSFRVGWISRNIGNTTNITVSGSSAAGFIEGNVVIGAPPRADGNDQTSVGTTATNVICFRNRLTFGNKRNRAELLPVVLSLSTQANKSAFFEIRANPVFGGDIDWAYVNKEASIMEVGKDAVTVTGGQLIGGITVVAGSSSIIEFNTRFWNKFSAIPGQVFSVTARVSSGSAADMQVIATWVEDI